ncbi:hypothetical protein B4064_0510 [Caldibacillus thermoamylovorans]|uniref:Uncharacterized protein n=1 Tax=Caldibacillus thermoamylovorans TaxID=35841 RepID=A0ABD4A647_9BACI|nr:hypothetical protein B4064_0510 [Caldibacillus thermoamylovorans]KIO70437.1 hypothetical protein B4166_0601 [Caldibacillus thermoamylovorans]KIO72331.1 hypothetical protein B4167_0659 [Caldibacillus thermoamylovorans]
MIPHYIKLFHCYFFHNEIKLYSDNKIAIADTVGSGSLNIND